MPEDYTNIVKALKALKQGEKPNQTVLPMAEDEWKTRPGVVSYGMVMLDYEVAALYGDNVKKATAYSGSVHLFSKNRDGAGWVELITGTLTEHCEGCWSLNHYTYERETKLFHWEWTFQVEG